MYFPNRQYLQVVTSYLFHNILLFHSLQSSLFSLVLSTVRDCSEPEDSCRLKCCGQVTFPSLKPKATFILDSTGENVLVQHDFTNPQCKFTGSNGEFECVSESPEKCHYQNFTCVVKLGLKSFSAPIEIPRHCKYCCVVSYCHATVLCTLTRIIYQSHTLLIRSKSSLSSHCYCRY